MRHGQNTQVSRKGLKTNQHASQCIAPDPFLVLSPSPLSGLSVSWKGG